MGIKRKKFKKPQKVLFKIKPLDWTKKVKIKKSSKPAKPPVKKTKPIKTVKPRKPKLVKPRSENLTTPPFKKRRGKLPKAVKFLLRGKPIELLTYKARIKVIGIGGGGSSIVSEITSQVRKGKFMVANTDFQALQRVAKETKRFQFGKSLTHGLGTGMNPEIGEQAAESEKDKIKEILKETDFCVLVSCLGGGTGSGASPVFAKILKNLKILTLGIFTLPFEFEGEKKAQIAKDSLEKLRQNLNALVIIPNQKIFQIIDKNTPLKESLSTINKALAESLEGLITLIDSPGLIHVDFANLKTILSGRGKLAYLNTAEVKNSDQIEELTKKILFNSLFPYNIKGAKEILFNIDGGLNLNMSQVEQVGKTISDSINPKVKVAFGITQNKKEGIKITLLVNGCKWQEWEKKKEKPEKESEEKHVFIVKNQEKPKKKAKTTTRLSYPLVLSTKGQAPKPKKLPEVPQSETPQTLVREKAKDSNPPATLPLSRAPVKIKVRQNALDYNPATTRQGKTYIRKALEEEEKKMLAQERKWETPTFLRRDSSSQTGEEVE